MDTCADSSDSLTEYDMLEDCISEDVRNSSNDIIQIIECQKYNVEINDYVPIPQLHLDSDDYYDFTDNVSLLEYSDESESLLSESSSSSIDA